MQFRQPRRRLLPGDELRLRPDASGEMPETGLDLIPMAVNLVYSCEFMHSHAGVQALTVMVPPCPLSACQQVLRNEEDVFWLLCVLIRHILPGICWLCGSKPAPVHRGGLRTRTPRRAPHSYSEE